ncbi:MAG: FecR domain-containing protein [Pseudomonadota bacterium]
MTSIKSMIGTLLAILIVVPVTAKAAEEIGQIKLVKGSVSIERDGETIDAIAGEAVQKLDVVRTGAGSAIGLTFSDNSRMSLGPNSEMALEKYNFAGKGEEENAFDARLTKGSMTAASGLIAKTPNAMRVLMPTTILGVRGTEFAVRVGEE